MTRAVVIQEGKQYPQGYVEHGAVSLAKDEIPVVVGWDNKLVGKARAMERDEETGVISVEIEMLNEFRSSIDPADTKHYSLSASCCPVEFVEKEPGRYNLVSGKIRGIYISVIPATPPEIPPSAEFPRSKGAW